MNLQQQDRLQAARQAQRWLDNDCLVLDTETTGLNWGDEICEIALIDVQGQPVMNTLVKPTRPIPDEVIRIHGITNEQVQDAPGWPELQETFCQLITNRTVVIYRLSAHFVSAKIVLKPFVYNASRFPPVFSNDTDFSRFTRPWSYRSPQC